VRTEEAVLQFHNIIKKDAQKLNGYVALVESVKGNQQNLE